MDSPSCAIRICQPHLSSACPPMMMQVDYSCPKKLVCVLVEQVTAFGKWCTQRLIYTWSSPQRKACPHEGGHAVDLSFRKSHS